MDLYTGIAINIVLQILEDKQKLPKVRKAVLKVFKRILEVFGGDEAFQAEMRRYVDKPES